MILLVGGTSRLGRAVAERMLGEGIAFRAACRDPKKARWLHDRGVEVVLLDLESGPAVARLMEGVTRVITCIHGLLGKSRQAIRRVDVDGHRLLIDAAAEAGVQRFVYISALGASPDHPSEFWRAKAQTEGYLKASGLDYVILRPSAFMDLYAHDLIGAAVLRGRTVFLLGDGTTPRNMVAVSDVADVAVLALSRENLSYRTIEVGSADNPTEREVAALYDRLSGKRSKVRAIPAPVLKVLSTAIAPFHAGIGHLLRLPLQLAGREDLCFEPPASIEGLGKSPVSLREYVQRRVKAAERA